MPKHRSDIVPDAAHWPTMVKRGATHTRDINKPFRTGRATHRHAAHRMPTPLEAARARVASGPQSSWDEHFAKTFISKADCA